MVALPHDPILYLGLDIGVKRDTTGLAALYQDYEGGHIGLWGHRIFAPPVLLEKQVLPVIMRLFETQRVAALLFDPQQAAMLEQRLREEGYGARLQEVNQLTLMTEACNTLHTSITEGRLLLYPDADVRSHFAVAAAKHTERGWRIIKQKQAKPIDIVVAIAMALLGLTDQVGHALHPSFHAGQHARSAWSLP
jgi:phage terminase large subunit-like protein